MIGTVRAIACAALLASAVAAEAARLVVQGAARIIDGDTFKIGAERGRLHGIDAPESAQHCHAADRR